MNKNLVLLTLLLPLLALAAEPQAATPAETPAETPAPAPAQARLPDAGVDEIDLEEADDAAEAAKRPTVKSSADKTGSVSLVDIDCDDATLADILRQFRKTTGANIISGESTNLARRVSVSLRRVPWLDALQAMLNTRGFRLEERGDIYFVSEDKQAVPILTKTFSLNHASCEELAELFNANYAPKDKNGKILQKIANAFAGANTLVVTAPEPVIHDCETIIRTVDRAVAQVYIEARFLELSTEALHTLGVQWDALQSWQVKAEKISAGFEKNGGEAAIYDAGRSSTFYSKKTYNSEGKDISDGHSELDYITQNQLVPGSIGAAPGANRQAADMAWKSAYGFSGQLSADDFALALSAFEQLQDARIFSNPKVIVANGKEAKVDMTTKFPNVELASQRNTSAAASYLDMSARLQLIPGDKDKGALFAGETFYSWGITLSVKPRISPDGLISVVIEPTISQLDRDVTASGFYEVQNGDNDSSIGLFPIINMKRITTDFTMKDGATAVIGGLSRTTEEDIDSGIPYLRKIPWIGPKLFGWKSRGKVQKEIIVCVTVGIADPANLQKDVGLPKNAVMGREYVNGTKQEPGDRTGSAANVLKLDMRELDRREKAEKDEKDGKDEKDKPAEKAAPAGTVTITPAA